MHILFIILGAIVLIPVAIVLATAILVGVIGGIGYLFFELFGGMIITILLIVMAFKLIKHFTSK